MIPDDGKCGEVVTCSGCCEMDPTFADRVTMMGGQETDRMRRCPRTLVLSVSRQDTGDTIVIDPVV